MTRSVPEPEVGDHVRELVESGQIGGRTVRLVRSGEVECASYPIGQLPDGAVRVRTVRSAISPGTEMTFYGRDATNVYLHKRWDEELRLFVAGEPSMDYPVFFGYRATGVVEESRALDVPVGTRLFGSWRHTERVTLPGKQAAAQRLPDDLSEDDGLDIAQMGPICVNAVAFAEGEQVGAPTVVFGAGPVGLIAAQMARARARPCTTRSAWSADAGSSSPWASTRVKPATSTSATSSTTTASASPAGRSATSTPPSTGRRSAAARSTWSARAGWSWAVCLAWPCGSRRSPRDSSSQASGRDPPGRPGLLKRAASIIPDARMGHDRPVAAKGPIDRLAELFGVGKPIVAMLHLPALPGRPRHDRSASLDAMVEQVGRDLEALQTAGVDGLLFCNEADLPYQLQVGTEIAAAMAAVVGQLRSTLRLPFGVNLLWDPMASLAVARATGARFIREVLTGVYESDLGMIEPRIGEIAAYRTQIGADDVALFDNIAPEFSSALGSRSVAERARGAAFLGVDAILISGPAAGVSFEMRDLEAAKEAVPETPVIANTGVRAERIAEIFRVADGAIVGTSLKVDGITWNPVDPDRARRLMDAARAAREAEQG